MLRFILQCLFLCVPAASLWAASITISPTSLDIEPKQKTASLKVINAGGKPVRLQVFVKAWSQDEEGATVVADTSDLIVYPKLLTVGVGEQQPVRVGFRGTWPKTERSFRLFLDELPERKLQQGVGVVFPVRISVPVFLTDGSPANVPSVMVSSVQAQSPHLRIGVHNQGDRHISVREIEAQLWDGKGHALTPLKKAGWYILAGGIVYYSLVWDQKHCQQAKKAEISLTFDKQKISAAFPLGEEHKCHPPAR